MALDASFIGRRYPPAEPYPVGRAKIAEFADAIGDPHPAYRDPAAARALGYSDVIAPPTFAFLFVHRAASALIEDPALGLDYSRVVHGDQRFVHTRPVRAGDELVTTVTVDNIRSMGGHDMITSRSDVDTVQGERVLTAYTTLVARGTG